MFATLSKCLEKKSQVQQVVPTPNIIPLHLYTAISKHVIVKVTQFLWPVTFLIRLFTVKRRTVVPVVSGGKGKREDENYKNEGRVQNKYLFTK
jgi:hypothetical protein